MLRIQDLGARYSEEAQWVIENINMELQPGDMVLITGPSGCGKSTFLKAVTGLLTGGNKVKGQITYEGQSLEGLRGAKRSQVLGTVLQNPDEQIVFEKVRDELAFPLENLNIPRENMGHIIEEWSQFMELGLDRPTAKLSGGQKQRLITGATLGMGQKVLFFDEPLAALDQDSAFKLLTKVKSLCQQEGYIAVVIEHRIGFLNQFANRIFYLEKNRLEEVDNLGEIDCCTGEKVANSIDEEVWLKSSESNEPVFTVENLRFKVKDMEIIKGIDYQFNKGGKYLIRGDNGCGKTTLLKLLAGLNKPTLGQVKVPFKKKHIFKQVGLVMQNPNYQLFMSTVLEELKFQSKSEEFMNQLVEIMDLGPILDRHPQSLSEGQKRRVGVAAILSMEPEILLLDEPSVGQDRKSMEGMMKAIAALAARKELTTISISHDQRCDLILGDIQIEMKNGVFM